MSNLINKLSNSSRGASPASEAKIQSLDIVKIDHSLVGK